MQTARAELIENHGDSPFADIGHARLLSCLHRSEAVALPLLNDWSLTTWLSQHAAATRPDTDRVIRHVPWRLGEKPSASLRYSHRGSTASVRPTS